MQCGMLFRVMGMEQSPDCHSLAEAWPYPARSNMKIETYANMPIYNRKLVLYTMAGANSFEVAS